MTIFFTVCPYSLTHRYINVSLLYRPIDKLTVTRVENLCQEKKYILKICILWRPSTTKRKKVHECYRYRRSRLYNSHFKGRLGCYSWNGSQIGMDRNFVCWWRRHNCSWSLPFCADLSVWNKFLGFKTILIYMQ